MARTAGPKKMCIMCNKVKAVTDFYPNRGWPAQQNCDLYCKTCARTMVHDEASLRKYMWENNRLYSEALWESAKKSANRILANNKEYISQRISPERKKEIEDDTTAKQALVVMNLAHFYRYNENADPFGNIDPFDPNTKAGMVVNVKDDVSVLDDSRKYYDAEWMGTYSKIELDYLNSYYKRLSDSFTLDDISAQDYARKVAKASLEADKRYELMRTGKCSSKDWREAQDIFDSLSKSSALTAAQRKDRDNTTNQSLAEIIEMIEVKHHAEMPKVTFPPDDIDKILADFAHTDYAIK